MYIVTIRIDTSNEAFSEDPDREVALILIDLAKDIKRGRIDQDGAPIRDYNGNTVGRVSIEVEEEEKE